MELTSKNVEDIIKDCLAEDEENPNGIQIEGILHTYLLDTVKLEVHREDIRSMIEQLPKEFLKSGGGGWSFLNLCMRADGVQWTGLHWVQEQFFAIAAGLSMAKIQIPRNLWSAFPGGMPYIVFDPEGSLV